ncbi:MAG: alpha/beta hydrolase [Steroidobacteraceae bacterium]|nr:alpha/beta hydrolase [Steroidobacteraceae bacterium]
MSTLSKLVVALLGLAAVGLATGWYLLNSNALEMPLEELEAKYRLPDSKWMDLDGIRVHYLDQSPAGVADPPVVVLSHASFMSLRSWDSLAQALLGRGWRVIRMDYLNAGLTSFDAKGVNDMQRNVMILTELPARLGVTRFDLVGTSSGGQTAFIFAGQHPERVGRFVLINSGGMPRTPQSNPNRARGSWWDQYLNARYRSVAQWEKNLGDNMPSLRPIPPQLVELVYDMNRREGLRPVAAQYLKNFRTGDTAAYLAAVKAPTMILQGMANPTLVHTEAEVQSYWMTGAPTLIRKYPKLGHYPYMESPAEVEADILAFLSGQYDGELRQTVRAAAAPATAAATADSQVAGAAARDGAFVLPPAAGASSRTPATG